MLIITIGISLLCHNVIPLNNEGKENVALFFSSYYMRETNNIKIEFSQVYCQRYSGRVGPQQGQEIIG